MLQKCPKIKKLAGTGKFLSRPTTIIQRPTFAKIKGLLLLLVTALNGILLLLDTMIILQS